MEHIDHVKLMHRFGMGYGLYVTLYEVRYCHGRLFKIETCQVRVEHLHEVL